MALTYTTREAVLNALETALKTVSWITEVDRQQVGLPEDYSIPKGVLIHDIREVRRTVLKDCIDVRYTVMIVVYVYDEDFDSLSTDLNAAMEEVKGAIQNYFTLSGIVDKTIVETADTDAGFTAPQANGTLVLEISYLSEK